MKVLSAFLGLLALPAFAGSVQFDSSWREQGFSLFSSNDYGLNGRSIEITSDGSVSMIFKAIPRNDWQATEARWHWSVSRSVVATDLTVKGGDDRNLALYFVFVNKDRAESLMGGSARRVFNDESTRTLVYVWGGNYPRDALLSSPFQPGKLVTVARRPASTGQFLETAELLRDFQSAYGTASGALIAIGISADSDDTDGFISAKISDLSLH